MLALASGVVWNQHGTAGGGNLCGARPARPDHQHAGAWLYVGHQGIRRDKHHLICIGKTCDARGYLHVVASKLRVGRVNVTLDDSSARDQVSAKAGVKCWSPSSSKSSGQGGPEHAPEASTKTAPNRSTAARSALRPR